MATINKGTLVVVYAGASGKPTVRAWSPSAYEQPSLVSALKILGVAMTDSEYEEPLAVMKRGYLRDMSDGAETWAVGDVLYASSTGTLTKTRPAGPLPQVIVGTVFAANASNWDIDIDVRVIPSLGELSGVSRETPADKDVFIYKSSTNVWEPRQIDHGADIAGLGDDDHTQYLKEEASGGTAAETPDHTHQSAATCGTLDHGLANTAASLADDDHPQYKKRHGFVRDNLGAHLVTMSYDKTTRKVTVTPTGASFDFYVNGTLVTKSGAQQTPSGHTATTGKWFLTYDAAGAFTWSGTPWDITDRTKIPVALVYYYTGLSDGVCFFEGHSAERNLALHKNLHATQGTKFISGFALSGYTLLTDTDAAVTFGVASGVIADEDIFHALSALTDASSYTTFYRTGAAGDWTWGSGSFPFQYGTTYPSWNNPDAGGAGVWGMTEATSGDYIVYFLCAVPSVAAATQLVLVPNQSNPTTLAQAQAISADGLAWGSLPFEEIAILYKIIYHTQVSYGGTHKVEIVQIDALKASGALLTSPGSATVHNSLGGRDVVACHPASSVVVVPFGTIEAINVQDALEEIISEASIAALDDIGDVDAAAPDVGDVLTWDGDSWNNAPPTGGADVLDDLSDVNAPAPGNGDVLAWNDGAGEWQPTAASAPGVHETTHEAGQTDELPVENMGTAETDDSLVLAPDGIGGVAWVSPAVVATLDDLSDVLAPAPNDGDVLTWSDGSAAWVPDTATATVASLDNVGDVNAPAPDDGDVLTWDATPGEWVALPAAGGTKTIHHQARFAMFSPPAGGSFHPVLEASGTINVVKVRAIHKGSGSLSVNVTKNYRGSPSDILASDLASSTAWVNAAASGGGVSLSAGDELDVELVSVTGYVEHIVVVIDYEETV